MAPGGRAGAMELLSALSLGELALSFSRVPLFPVFDLSYFIVSILYLKYEPGEPGRGAEGAGSRGRGPGQLGVAERGSPCVVEGAGDRFKDCIVGVVRRENHGVLPRRGEPGGEASRTMKLGEGKERREPV